MDFPNDINLRDISKLAGSLPDAPDGDDIRNLFDRAIDKISRNKSSSNLVIVTTPKATPIAAMETATDLASRTFEPTKTTGEAIFTDKTGFVPKPLPHSPKISPSSIPNPNPSVTITKQMETSFPSYSNYLFSIPGYSAFQPVAYQGMSAPNTVPKPIETANQSTSTDFIQFPAKKAKTNDYSKTEKNKDKNADVIVKTDFEDKFTTEIVTSITTTQGFESRLNITSLRQGSGATVTIPQQIDTIKKSDIFNLKTSTPITKIDMKCANPNDSNQSNVPKKPLPFNPAFQNNKIDGRVEIQSNVVIKGASNEIDEKNDLCKTNNINTLINAAEVVNKNDNTFWNIEPKQDTQNEAKDLSNPNSSTKPIFNPVQHDTKLNFIKKPPDGADAEQKNQIVFIQSKTNNNPKMLLALTQQQKNAKQQALSQKTTDSKNLLTPSRLSNVNENCKEELIKENGSSKVVSLKRLHHENCDEDDFENLITENQIYGNKIVVKERSQGTMQEQDIKLAQRTKQSDGKNMVLQPNFLYVSNVQFPANVMMIKNNNKINQNITEQLKNNNRIDNKANNTSMINYNNSDAKQTYTKPTSNIVVSKEIHVLKTNNSVLQTLAGKQNKQDVIFQTNQKMIMNPQIIYQVPMLVDGDSQKLGSTFLNQSYSKYVTQKNEIRKEQQTKQNDKLYIACPYQIDSKLQPKIVFTNMRPKIPKEDEISTLDIYEKRKKQRRLKHQTNVNNITKSDSKKNVKQDNFKNIITADNMKDEMCKEFAKTKIIYDDSITDSDSDYEMDELKDYADVIQEYADKKQIKEDIESKKSFLAIFKLGTHDCLQEWHLEKHERIIQADAVAKACIAAGRLDKLANEQNQPDGDKPTSPEKTESLQECEIESNIIELQKKQVFLARLQLARVSRQYKEDYERAWKEIVRERQRRNGYSTKEDKPKIKIKHNEINSNDQLKLLSDIKSSVTENNNAIKRRLDAEINDVCCDANNICAMAEKSFSDLSRLSQMADKSVQILSGKETRKRDLNPGFDSERIQKPVPSTEPLKQSQFPINIPNISKIISLRTELNNTNEVTTPPPAQPLDEPKYSLRYKAYNHIEIIANPDISSDETKSETVEFIWPGEDAVRKSYKNFDSERKKEIQDLLRRNTQLRVDCANAKRTAAREAELIRTLFVERRTLANDEECARHALNRLFYIINTVRNYK